MANKDFKRAEKSLDNAVASLVKDKTEAIRKLRDAQNTVARITSEVLVLNDEISELFEAKTLLKDNASKRK